MEDAPVVRTNVVLIAGLTGLLVLGATLVGINVSADNLHWNDLPLFSQDVVDPHSAFAKGRPLYCSGIESMAPSAALDALREKGYSVRIQHDFAASSESVKRIPKGAVLQEVGAAPDSNTAFMFVMTPEHPRFDEGYFGSMPAQDC